MDGVRLAVSWLSVLPIPARTVDVRSCRQAITLAPLVGALLGGLAAAILFVAVTVGAPPLVAGLLALVALTLLTRGMHLDGLADTVDGLGCYGSPERALTVMRGGSAGPFAVVGLILVLGLQTASLAQLAVSGNWSALVLACAAGRAAFVFCCRQGIPSARPEGMGALVAGSQHPFVVDAWWGVLLVAALLTQPVTGPVGIVLAVLLLLTLTVHVRRRLGGITGDVLGAASELVTTIILVTSSFS